MNLQEYKDRLDKELEAWHIEIDQYNRLVEWIDILELME